MEKTKMVIQIGAINACGDGAHPGHHRKMEVAVLSGSYPGWAVNILMEP